MYQWLQPIQAERQWLLTRTNIFFVHQNWKTAQAPCIKWFVLKSLNYKKALGSNPSFMQKLLVFDEAVLLDWVLID